MPKTPDVVDQEVSFTPDFLHIPSIVGFDKELQPLDVLVYGVVFWLERLKDGRCWASNATLAKLIGSSSNGVNNSLNRLRKQEYIQCSYDDKNHRTGIVTLVFAQRATSNEVGGLPQTRYIDNNTKTKYTMEIDKQMQILHRRYVQMFKIDPTDWRQASTDERSSLLQAALSRYKLTDARKTKLAARLKDGGFEMCHQALVNADKEDWNHGDNDRGWKMDLYDYLFRNYEMVERWANKDDAGGRND